MSNRIIEIAQDNWPYVLGGFIGLYLIYRYYSGGSQSQAAPVYVGGAGMPSESFRLQSQAMTLQTQSSLAMAEMQKEVALEQLDVERFEIGTGAGVAVYDIDARREVGLADINASVVRSQIGASATVAAANAAAYATTERQRIQTAGDVAMAREYAAVEMVNAQSGMIRAINEPTTLAINSATATNLATINAMTQISVNETNKKADVTKTAIAAGAGVTVAAIDANARMAGAASPAVYPQNFSQVRPPDNSWIADTALAFL